MRQAGMKAKTASIGGKWWVYEFPHETIYPALTQMLQIPSDMGTLHLLAKESGGALNVEITELRRTETRNSGKCCPCG